VKTKKNELTLSIALYFYVIGMGIVFLMGMLFRVDLDTLRAMALGGTIGIVSALALSFYLQYLNLRNVNGPLPRNWKNLDGRLISDSELERLKEYLTRQFPQVSTIGNLSVGKTGLYSTSSIRIVLQQSTPHVSCEFELISSGRTLQLRRSSHEEEIALYQKLASALRMFGFTGS